MAKPVKTGWWLNKKTRGTEVFSNSDAKAFANGGNS